MSDLHRDRRTEKPSVLETSRIGDRGRLAVCALGIATLASAVLCARPASKGAGPAPSAGGPGERAQTGVASDIPRGYVPVGAGLTDVACVHEVPEGAVVDASRVASGGDVTVSQGGRRIAAYSACKHPRMSSLARSGAARFPPQLPPTTWVEDSEFPAPSSPYLLRWFSGIEGDWVVPPDPTDTSGTLHFFNALQDSNNGNELVQAVLTWDGTLARWTLEAYYCNLRTGCLSSQTYPPAFANDTIHGSVEASNCTPQGLCHWTIVISNKTRGTSTSLDVDASYAMGMAYPAVYERYNVTNCNQNPGAAIVFTNTYVYMPYDGAAKSSYDVAGSTTWIQWPNPPPANANYNPPCHNGVVIGTRGTTLQY